MESKSCWLLLVLVFGISANEVQNDDSNPKAPPGAQPNVPPQVAEPEKNLAPVRGLGEECEENQQCEELGSAECKQQKCTCKTGAEVVNRKCWIKKNIGDTCDQDEDCKDANCKANKCACKDGMVAHSNGKSCLQGATKVGDPCEETGQCRILGEATCENNICKCSKDHHEKNNLCIKTPYIGEKCNHDEDCKVTSTDANCKANKCACKDGMVAHSNGKQCLQGATKVGETCKETNQCRILGGATCEKSICKCSKDHHEKNNLCIKTLYLGDKCVGVEGECFLPNSDGTTTVECKKTCVCKDLYVPSEDKKHCRKPVQKDHGSGGGAASVYPFFASIVTIVAALLLTS